MLLRVVLASLCLANVVHAEPRTEASVPKGSSGTQAGTEATQTLVVSSTSPSHMTTYTPPMRTNHRYLDAYIRDTVRFIRTLDNGGRVVVETWAGTWANLGGENGVAFGLTDPMDPEIPDIAEMMGAAPMLSSYLPVGKP